MASRRLRQIVAAVLEMDSGDVPDTALLYEDLGVSSLEKVAIAEGIGREFAVTFTAEEALEIRTISDAVSTLQRKGVVGRGSNLVDLLVGGHVAAGHGDRISYIDPDVGEVSYRRLYELAGTYADVLAERQVTCGTRGLIVADDSVATVVAVLGMWWHGCVPIVVSPVLGDAELRYIADDSAAGVVHLDAVAPTRQRTLTELFAGWRRTAGDDVRAWLTSAMDVTRPSEANGGLGTAGARSAGAPPVEVDPDAEALVQYTSGTTGVPKGARHRTAGVEAVLDGFGQVQALRPDDVVLSTARMSFSYGYGSSLLSPLAAGASTVLIRGTVDIHALTATVKRHRPTVLYSVPRMYAALLDPANHQDLSDYAALRLCVTAGENCPAELRERIRRRLAVELVNGLGASELLYIVMATPPGTPDAGRIGPPAPGVTATVRDEKGQRVPDGTEGRLHIAAGSVAMGYIGRPEADGTAFADGGFYTGDLVRCDGSNEFEYLCRADDLLNLGGYKVAPGEIEAVVRETDGVAQCAVVGVADRDGLQEAVLYLVADAGTDREVVRRNVKAVVRRGLAAFKRPGQIEFLDSLPVTSNGKLAAYRLRTRAAHQ